MWIALLLVGASWADCAVESSMGWKGDTLRGSVSVAVTEGPVPCRSLVLGAAHEFHLTQLKGVVRPWDGSKHRVGLERLVNEDGQWTVHLPELRAKDVAVLKFVGVPSGEGAAWSAPESKDEPEFVRNQVRWLPVEKPMFGPQGNVAMEVRRTVRIPAGVGAHRFWFPPGVTGGGCAAVAQGADTAVSMGQVGCALEARLDGPVTLSLWWRVSHASSAMEWTLAPGESLEISDAEVLAAGLDASATDGISRFVGPGQVSVRVTRLGDVEIPDTALEAVRFGARSRSMVEPGVGVEYKGTEVGVADLLPLLERLRERVVPGQLPGQHPLKPRYLLNVRASGWATPWESALILSRYLEQLGFDARPLPVRPRAMGVAAAGAPIGYTGAVVRVQKGGERVWLDPSCRACGLDEIAPEFWGGAVFDDQIEFVPSVPKSTVGQQLNGDVLHVHLSGPAAVTFRHFVMELPRSDPLGPKIAALFGGPGAHLRSAEGINELGTPVELTIEVQSLK
jgi:hypothetical protein